MKPVYKALSQTPVLRSLGTLEKIRLEPTSSSSKQCLEGNRYGKMFIV